MTLIETRHPGNYPGTIHGIFEPSYTPDYDLPGTTSPSQESQADHDFDPDYPSLQDLEVARQSWESLAKELRRRK